MLNARGIGWQLEAPPEPEAIRLTPDQRRQVFLVFKEAITNAVIHRDYRLNRDIQIRIFDNRIEIESPGMFPGTITPSNVAKAGSFARNPLIARNLREFPEPPNVDAGEGVRMMFAEMRADSEQMFQVRRCSGS